MKPRARQLGLPLPGIPGTNNAITDVAGVEVGHSTIIRGQGRLVTGKGPVRTGVTAILPRGKTYNPVMAGWYSLNGNGEMTGTTWVEESGFLYGPLLITNTHSVGVVRDAAIEWQIQHRLYDPACQGVLWFLPVVAETYDGFLNDINGFHIKKEHVFAALDNAAGGVVAEGNVGGGTGMRCHQFKGGIGTASRLVKVKENTFTVAALVQANYGKRPDLTICGVPIGQEIPDLMPELVSMTPMDEAGSIIVVMATDAPLMPHQLKRLARRVPMGIARLGGTGSNFSGDIFLAFSTANSGAAGMEAPAVLVMLPNEQMDPLIDATIQSVEESIINALLAAETMTGINGNITHALPHDRLLAVMKKYNRLSSE